MNFPINIRILSKSQVDQLITPEDVVQAVEDTFREIGNGNVFHPVHAPMWMDNDRANMFLASPSYLKGSHSAAVKWVNLFSKQQPGLPSSYGNLLLLSNSENAMPYAIMEASTITTMRTAGGHGVVSAKYLAKKGSSVLAVIGCGEEAKAGIRSFLKAFPDLKQINIHSRRQESMDTIVDLFGDQISITCYDNAKAAVETADIVLVTTTATTPVVMFDWLKKGAFVSGMYSFNDLDPSCTKRADKWYVGEKTVDSHNIVHFPPMLKYHLSDDDIYGDLAEVVTGKCPGRENDDEIIVFTHMGMGALDNAVGNIVYQRAVEQNIGTIIDFS